MLSVPGVAVLWLCDTGCSGVLSWCWVAVGAPGLLPRYFGVLSWCWVAVDTD